MTQAQLQNKGIAVKPARRRPGVDSEQAIRTAVRETGVPVSHPAAKLFRITTERMGRYDESGIFHPSFVNRLAWVVTVHYIGVPYRGHVVGATYHPQHPHLIALTTVVDASSGRWLFAFTGPIP